MPDYRFTGDISEVIVSGVNVVAEPVVPPARLSGGKRRAPIVEDEPSPTASPPDEPEADPTDRWREEATPLVLEKAARRYFPPPATTQFSRAGKQKQRAIRRLNDDVFAAQLGSILSGVGVGSGTAGRAISALNRTTWVPDMLDPATRDVIIRQMNRIRYWVSQEHMHPDFEPPTPTRIKRVPIVAKRWPGLQRLLQAGRSRMIPIGLTLIASAVAANEFRRWDYQRVFKEPAPGQSAWDSLWEQ